MTRLYVILGVVIFVLMARLLSSDGGVSELFALQGELKTMEKALDEQQAANERLQHKVMELRSEDSVVETLARQTLGMIGEDEVFVEVIELPKYDPSVSQAEVSGVTELDPNGSDNLD